MFRELFAREIGILNPKQHMHTAQSREIKRIDLSSAMEIEYKAYMHFPITALEIDLTENRYLLSAAGNHIDLFDIESKGNTCVNNDVEDKNNRGENERKGNNRYNNNDDIDVSVSADHRSLPGHHAQHQHRSNLHTTSSTIHDVDADVLAASSVTSRRRLQPHAKISPLFDHNQWGEGHEFTITSLVWYPFDTGLFASACTGGSVHIWDTNQLQVAQSFQFDCPVHDVKMSSVAHTHTLIAAALKQPNIRLCDMTSGGFSHVLIGHKGTVNTIAWSPNNEYVLASGGSDNTIRVWDIRRAGAMMIFDQYNNINPKINRKYLNHEDERRTKLVQSHNGPVNKVKFSPDGLFLLSAGNDRRLRKWDVMTGKNTLINYANTLKCDDFSVSCDGKYIFYPNDLVIDVYEMESGRKLKALRGHYDDILALSAHSHKPLLFSGGRDQTILCWDAPKPSIVEEDRIIRYNHDHDNNRNESDDEVGEVDNAINQILRRTDIQVNRNDIIDDDNDDWSSDSDDGEG